MRGDLTSMSVETLCSNRHLPLYRSQKEGDDRETPRTGGEAFGLAVRVAPLKLKADLGADCAAIVAGPSSPREGVREGRKRWDIVSHLALNHLSITDSERGEPVEALRQMLRLYAPLGAGSTGGIVDNIRSVSTRSATGRLPPAAVRSGNKPRPVIFTRGMEIDLTFDERESRAPLLGGILERFFAGYASTNGFTRTRLIGPDGKEKVRWMDRAGLRKTL